VICLNVLSESNVIVDPLSTPPIHERSRQSPIGNILDSIRQTVTQDIAFDKRSGPSISLDGEDSDVAVLPEFLNTLFEKTQELSIMPHLWSQSPLAELLSKLHIYSPTRAFWQSLRWAIGEEHRGSGVRGPRFFVSRSYFKLHWKLGSRKYTTEASRLDTIEYKMGNVD